jgi:hypothetical protein
MAPCPWPPDRIMDRREAGDGEGGDSFAGTTGTFVVHHFDHNGGERGNTTRTHKNIAFLYLSCSVVFLSWASLINTAKEVDIKEGEDEKEEKRTLRYSSICKHSSMCNCLVLLLLWFCRYLHLLPLVACRLVLFASPSVAAGRQRNPRTAGPVAAVPLHRS